MKRKRSKAKIRLAGDPILSTICEPVADDEEINHITRDMSHILNQSKTGVGLSANQAGHAKRIIIIKVKKGVEILINPVILEYSKSTAVQSEGCLSYPGQFVKIKRATCVKVKCRDWTERYYNFESRIVQHEIDHLNGICKVGTK